MPKESKNNLEIIMRPSFPRTEVRNLAVQSDLTCRNGLMNLGVSGFQVKHAWSICTLMLTVPSVFVLQSESKCSFTEHRPPFSEMASSAFFKSTCPTRDHIVKMEDFRAFSSDQIKKI